MLAGGKRLSPTEAKTDEVGNKKDITITPLCGYTSPPPAAEPLLKEKPFGRSKLLPYNVTPR